MYLNLDSPVYQHRQLWPKYSSTVSPLSAGYLAAGAMLRRRLPAFDKELHVATGKAWVDESERIEREYHKHVNRELGFLAGKGVDPGPLISGVVSDKFPGQVKDELRKMASFVSGARSAAMAHFAAAGLRHATALRLLHRSR